MCWTRLRESGPSRSRRGRDRRADSVRLANMFRASSESSKFNSVAVRSPGQAILNSLQISLFSLISFAIHGSFYHENRYCVVVEGMGTMVLGMSLATFTLVHVLISLAGIGSGLIVVYGLLTANRLNGWTAIFLVTTILTSLTGYLFPVEHIL